MDGVVDFIKHNQIPGAAHDFLSHHIPGPAGQFFLFRQSFLVFRIFFIVEHKTVAHGSDFYAPLCFPQRFDGLQLPVLPGPFDELENQNFLSVAPGADGGPKSSSGLSFARSRINKHKSFCFHMFPFLGQEIRYGRNVPSISNHYLFL